MPVDAVSRDILEGEHHFQVLVSGLESVSFDYTSFGKKNPTPEAFQDTEVLHPGIFRAAHSGVCGYGVMFKARDLVFRGEK